MSNTRRFLSLLSISALLPLALLAGGCGDSGGSSSASDTAKAGAKSLTQAMNRAALSFDDIGSTRASLDRFGQDIGGPIAQTSDVIALLGGDNKAEQVLLTAARQQRTFLQAAEEAATSRTRDAAVRAANNARSAGRRAAASYSRVIATSDELAGLVPAATTFNSSALRRGVNSAWSGSGKTSTKTSTDKNNNNNNGGNGGNGNNNNNGGTATGGVTDCGGGVAAGNSATSCPFARNVADEYRASGGASVIDVYSPVTGRTYTMSCVGAAPVVCSGGNGAVVRIR